MLPVTARPRDSRGNPATSGLSQADLRYLNLVWLQIAEEQMKGQMISARKLILCFAYLCQMSDVLTAVSAQHHGRGSSGTVPQPTVSSETAGSSQAKAINSKPRALASYPSGSCRLLLSKSQRASAPVPGGGRGQQLIRPLDQHGPSAVVCICGNPHRYTDLLVSHSSPTKTELYLPGPDKHPA